MSYREPAPRERKPYVRPFLDDWRLFGGTRNRLLGAAIDLAREARIRRSWRRSRLGALVAWVRA